MTFTPELWILAGTVFTGLITLAGAIYAASRPSMGASALKDSFAALTETVKVLQTENDRLLEKISSMQIELTDLHAAFENYKLEATSKIEALYAQLGRARKD